MTIKELARRGVSQCEIARKLDVTEGAVRYHLRRQASGATDGRARQVHLAEECAEAIDHWLGSRGGKDQLNLAALHGWLVEEHGYSGSLRSIQRYFKARYPAPRKRARRRVETPPGAQAQADWAEFPRLWIAGRRQTAYAFHLALSHSRHDAVVWSPRKHELAWLDVHNGAFRRLEGIAAVVRVDNEKTAICHGAGAWGTVHPAYRRYAEMVRFRIDACPPRSPQFKGKVERRIRDHRLGADPRHRHWNSYAELQAWTDARVARSARRRRCPATGTSVFAAWQAEKPFLAPLPVLPEPFDIAITRPVMRDCMVAFESRRYSVPFRFVGQRVEVRGCAHTVQIVAEGGVVAEHPRHTAEQILIDEAHYQGEATAHVIPPPPLGRMGQRMREIAALPPEQRPIDQYAAYAEVAR
jgi:transposase